MHKALSPPGYTVGRRSTGASRHHGLPGRVAMLCNNIMSWPFSDPLALSSGAGARLALAAGEAAVLWLAVFWAMAA